MTTNVLVTFYSTYGHVHRMARGRGRGRGKRARQHRASCAGSRSSKRRARRYQPRTPMCGHSRHRPTFLWSRTTICAGPTAIAWGTPTRYGNMSAQMKQFVDTTGGLWLKGELEDKATGIFTSTASYPRGPGDDDPDGARPVDPSRHGVCRHPIRTEPATTRNRRHRWLALRTRHPSRNRTARGSRWNQSSQPHATSAVALLAWRAVSRTSG